MLHPILLTGVALVGLPILLHLIMRRQPKRLPFPAFRFLKLRSRTNQRRIRIQNILLLILRMLLIALMAAALFQPRLLSERFHLQAEQPLAVVVIIDASPSMGYAPGDQSSLDEAKRRALEMLDELPAESAVAVIDTGGTLGPQDWSQQQTIDAAREQIKRIAGPSGGRSVTAAIDEAYRLFQKLDQERTGPDGQPLPRFLAVFSDRATHAWDVDRLDDLKAQRDKIPAPAVNSVFVDVGTDEPLNLSLGSTEVSVAFNDRNEAVTDITVNVRAEGKDVENVAVCRIDGEGDAERLPVSLKAGRSGSLTFRKTGLAQGLHWAEISLVSSDSLAYDNVRYVTFLVPEKRPVLIISDDPANAAHWDKALDDHFWFQGEVVTPADVRDWKPEDWNDYVAVTLIAVAEPERPLWDALTAYVQRGGYLVVIPGGTEMRQSAYWTAQAQELMPGQFVEVIEAEDPAKGTGWPWDNLNYQNALLAPFRRWTDEGNVDFMRLPPSAYRYWKVEPGDKLNVIVSYTDADLNPALLERAVGQGKVVMYTVPMDRRLDDRYPESSGRMWTDYSQTSFDFVLPNLTIRYLAGDQSEREYNFPTGSQVQIPLPLSEAARADQSYVFDGPGVSVSDARIRRQEPQRVGGPAALTIGPKLTGTPGNFTVQTEDRSWVDGFALNPPASESLLAKAEVEQVEGLLGEGSVIAPEKELELSEVLQRRFNQPLDLFPWLMILLLMLFVLEGLLANRFYRRPAQEAN